MQLTARLKTIIIIYAVAALVFMGIGAAIYSHFAPKPTIETEIIQVETDIPDINLELSDTKPAQNVPDLGKLPRLTFPKVKNDSLRHAHFKIDRERYFGGLDVYYSIMQDLFSYDLKLTVKTEPVFVEVPVETTKFEIVKNKVKLLYVYAGFGLGYDFNEIEKDESLSPDFGTVSIGVAIKKTIPIYFQFNTSGLISIHAAVIF